MHSCYNDKMIVYLSIFLKILVLHIIPSCNYYVQMLVRLCCLYLRYEMFFSLLTNDAILYSILLPCDKNPAIRTPITPSATTKHGLPYFYLKYIILMITVLSVPVSIGELKLYMEWPNATLYHSTNAVSIAASFIQLLTTTTILNLLQSIMSWSDRNQFVSALIQDRICLISNHDQ